MSFTCVASSTDTVANASVIFTEAPKLEMMVHVMYKTHRKEEVETHKGIDLLVCAMETESKGMVPTGWVLVLLFVREVAGNGTHVK